MRFRKDICIDGVIMPWVVEHVALLINRYLSGNEGKTAYRRIHRREALVLLCEFGGPGLACFATKRAKAKRRLLLAPRSTLDT